MKRAFFVRILILIISLIKLYGEDFIDYYYIYSNFFPNDEGDERETKLINYIKKILDNNKVEYSISKIDIEDFYSNSNNIEVIIKGKKDNENIIYIIPYNSFFYKDRYLDNSIGIYIGIKLIQHYIENKLNKNLVVVFTGASSVINDERWGIKQYFANKTGRLDNSIVNILDLVSINEKIKVSGSMKQKPVSSDILRIILNILKKYNFLFFDFSEIDRAKFSNYEQNISFGYLPDNIKVKVIRFTNMENEIFDKYKNFFVNNFDEILKLFINWTKELDNINVEYYDYNYLLVRYGNIALILQEYFIILFYLIIIFFILIVRRTAFVYKKLELSSTTKNVTYFLFFITVNFLFNFVVYVFFKVVEIVSYNKIVINENSFVYMFFLVINSFFLFNIFINFLPFNIRNLLFVNTAIIGSYVNLVLYSFVNINFGLIFVFSLILLNLSHLTGRNFLLKYITYILSFLPIMFFIFKIEPMSAFDNLLQNRFIKLIIVTVTFFPIVMILLRMNFINRVVFNISPSKTSLLFQLFLSWIIFFVIMIISSRFHIKEINKINVIYKYDSIENKNNIILLSKNKMDNIVYFMNGKKYILKKIGKSYVFDIYDNKNFEKPYKTIFNRNGGIFFFEILSEEKIEKINIIMKINKDVTFSQINKKYELLSMDSDYTTYKIYSERNIGNRYLLFFDLPYNNTIEIKYDIVYNKLPDHIKFEEINEQFFYKSIYQDYSIWKGE